MHRSRPRGGSFASRGYASRTIAITIPMRTKTTIATCTAIQKRGTAGPRVYSIIAWRSAIATAWVRVSA